MLKAAEVSALSGMEAVKNGLAVDLTRALLGAKKYESNKPIN